MELKDRFKQARIHKGLSQLELAEKAHTSQVMVSKIELGKTLQPRRLEMFAGLLGVSPEWLIYGINPPHWAPNEENVVREPGVNYVVIPHVREVPIVSWVRAGDFCNTETQMNIDDFELIICPEKNASEKTFALRVVGDSMTNPYGRSYPEGTIIFVDPLKTAAPGDRVVARTSKGHTFKELAQNDFGEFYLKPLNPNPSHELIIEEGIEICGVVIGSYFKE
ncbi:LexA family transcriptional regulator [Photobacterium sp. TLY01]|uniref:LexA family protein n=1 Tax=Photobacterium sp. TLY01 TaxID=2907534 RepID=UPI001F4171A4|nr:XRE family transcriptional regulator [Photobacterium sp. TLY01]UIP28861.1 XRE family transcriptional regulator [Photobacterium sp. TLY01]